VASAAVGLVLPVLPALDRRGERPSILVGTSVGAINAAFLASGLHSGAEEAAARLLARLVPEPDDEPVPHGTGGSEHAPRRPPPTLPPIQ
jgi:predicted acylesterase/phospholipase RssA